MKLTKTNARYAIFFSFLLFFLAACATHEPETVRTDDFALLDQVYGESLIEIQIKVDAFEKDFPGASEEEVTAYLVGLLKDEVRRNPKTGIDPLIESELETTQIQYDDFPPINRVNLNDQERVLCNQSIIRCTAFLSAGAAATQNSALYFFWQDFGRDNEKDAYRHANWNALMTIQMGANLAKLFADAHEFGSETQGPGLGREMDLYNNEQGRQMALRTSTRGSFEVYEQLKDNGRLRIFERPNPLEREPSGTSLVPSDTYVTYWPPDAF